VAETRAELEALTITAPIDGMVIHAEQGRWTERRKVREGDNVRRRQTIIELPDLSELLVEIRINELDAEMIEIGQEARVQLEAYPGLQLPGTVIDVSTLAQEFQGNVKVFPAVIRLDEPDPRARPGMTASADIVVKRLDDVVQIPLAAVGIVEGRTYVRPHDSHDPIEVSLGLWNDSMAQVLDGLEVEDEIDLAWLQDPATVLATLAGTKTVPEEVAQAILAMGDSYGAASPVVAMDEIMMQGSEESARGSEGRMRGSGETGARGQQFDRSQINPEAMDRMIRGGEREAGASREGAVGGETGVQTRQAGTEGTQPGATERQQGGQMMSRLNEQLQEMLQNLPEDLRAEAARLMSGQGDFRNISEALRDSMRAMRGGGQRQAGQFMMRSAPDSAETARRLELLREKRASLSDELKMELDSFIEGGASNFRSLSPALMDSIRAWGILGRGGRQRTPPPIDESDYFGRYFQ
jgi:hypothetical protein